MFNIGDKVEALFCGERVPCKIKDVYKSLFGPVNCVYLLEVIDPNSSVRYIELPAHKLALISDVRFI